MTCRVIRSVKVHIRAYYATKITPTYYKAQHYSSLVFTLGVVCDPGKCVWCARIDPKSPKKSTGIFNARL
ncbi:unnamed protein product [Blumeria hordei]|uniref:Uncharacterized protein n=1 Tax=Blumeria hordei TaxID=2867405 RepID=A0A383UPU4_BLUHO|nr:unnamed protein product [Blumeria hordei]